MGIVDRYPNSTFCWIDLGTTGMGIETVVGWVVGVDGIEPLEVMVAK